MVMMTQNPKNVNRNARPSRGNVEAILCTGQNPGPWGSGKTTLMETVKRLLKENVYSDDKRYRKWKTVWFQAWKYGNKDEIL